MATELHIRLVHLIHEAVAQVDWRENISCLANSKVCSNHTQWLTCSQAWWQDLLDSVCKVSELYTWSLAGAKPARLCSVQQDVKIDMSPMCLSTETSSIRLYIGSGLYVHKYIYIYIYMHVQRERERSIQTYYISTSLHPQGQWARKYIWHLLIWNWLEW